MNEEIWEKIRPKPKKHLAELHNVGYVMDLYLGSKYLFNNNREEQFFFSYLWITNNRPKNGFEEWENWSKYSRRTNFLFYTKSTNHEKINCIYQILLTHNQSFLWILSLLNRPK